MKVAARVGRKGMGATTDPFNPGSNVCSLFDIYSWGNCIYNSAPVNNIVYNGASQLPPDIVAPYKPPPIDSNGMAVGTGDEIVNGIIAQQSGQTAQNISDFFDSANSSVGSTSGTSASTTNNMLLLAAVALGALLLLKR